MKRFTMLVKAIAVIAIAGAALAFTPKKTTRLCIDDSDPNTLCDNFFVGTVVQSEGTPVSYVQGFTPSEPDDCSGLSCSEVPQILVTDEEPPK